MSNCRLRAELRRCWRRMRRHRCQSYLPTVPTLRLRMHCHARRLRCCRLSAATLPLSSAESAIHGLFAIDHCTINTRPFARVLHHARVRAIQTVGSIAGAHRAFSPSYAHWNGVRRGRDWSHRSAVTIRRQCIPCTSSSAAMCHHQTIWRFASTASRRSLVDCTLVKARASHGHCRSRMSPFRCATRERMSLCVGCVKGPAPPHHHHHRP